MGPDGTWPMGIGCWRVGSLPPELSQEQRCKALRHNVLRYKISGEFFGDNPVVGWVRYGMDSVSSAVSPTFSRQPVIITNLLSRNRYPKKLQDSARSRDQLYPKRAGHGRLRKQRLRRQCDNCEPNAALLPIARHEFGQLLVSLPSNPENPRSGQRHGCKRCRHSPACTNGGRTMEKKTAKTNAGQHR